MIKNLISMAIAFVAVAFLIQVNVVNAKDITLTIYANGKEYNFSQEEIASYKGKYYLKDVKNVVDKIYLDTLVREKNATCTFDFSSKDIFYFTKEKEGLALDKDLLIKDIDCALNNGNNNVIGRYNVVKPKMTTTILKEETYLRGRFTTYYSYSEEGRKQNISLSTQKISNTVLKDGEEFSFNKTVGERTEENGFTFAKIIINGDYSDGLGGGVCQTSTTLYNCALVSGLKITEQHPHSLQVGYIEPSFDAMVNSYTTDLRFVNNTGGTIYIGGIADGERVTFSIYGKKPTSVYERVYKITGELDCNEFIYEEDFSLKTGESKFIRQPKKGITSEGFLIEYVNGVRVKNVKLRSDKYSSVKGIIKVGKG